MSGGATPTTRTTTRTTLPYRDGFQSVFQFIQHHLDNGQSVLIHCLAGAHRAGTTGVAWLLYQHNIIQQQQQQQHVQQQQPLMNVQEAIQLAQSFRPIIRPFGVLLECLHVLEHELKLLKQVQEQEHQHQPTRA